MVISLGTHRVLSVIADQNVETLHPFEIVFVLFAAAFALEEYTASKEHGWESEYASFRRHSRGSCTIYHSLHRQCEIRDAVPLLLWAHQWLQMWNVFDTAFVLIFLLFVVMRIRGLVFDDREYL